MTGGMASFPFFPGKGGYLSVNCFSIKPYRSEFILGSIENKHLKNADTHVFLQKYKTPAGTPICYLVNPVVAGDLTPHGANKHAIGLLYRWIPFSALD